MDLKIPYTAVENNWDLLQKYLISKGNPKYTIIGDVDLTNRNDIQDLGNLIGVDGNLKLSRSSIESLGNLKIVTGDLSLYDCTNLTSLNMLKIVGRNLDLRNLTISSINNTIYVRGNLNITFSEINEEDLSNIHVNGKIVNDLRYGHPWVSF
jgi:hypothetical protein